ncbi:MAG: right-handed parallel beta-helix repeat-containing protein [Polyangiaceae bacterium]
MPNSDHAKGAGVSASSGGSVTLTGVALVGNSEEGAFSDGAGSTVTLSASIARDGVMLTGNTAGNGAVAQNGGKLVLTDSALIGNHESGLLMFDPLTSAEVTHSIIARQLPSTGKQFGRGVVLQNGPTLTMSQSVVAFNTDIGISARGAGSTATISESVLRDTGSQLSDGAHGRALNIIEQAQVTVSKCELLRNAEVSALVSGGSAQLSVDSSVIASTNLDTKSKSAGRGFAAQTNGIGVVTGSLIVDNFQVGVSAAGVGGQLTLGTSLVDKTKALSDGTFGHGILANDNSTLVLSSSTSRGSAGVGLIVGGSTATVSHCRILDNAVGINVQDGSLLSQVDTVPTEPTALDVDVSNDTVFDGNQTRIGSDELPIPTPLN